ncbi:MAG: hypothetical protein GQ583_08420 [Methyloprofundus sp.]|nr:hypothetical protein [Methyloprofundus sp.]
MSQLRRMLLSNVGYQSAYYPGTLLNFCKPDTNPSENTVLWLANQGGKTTLISLLFTIIEPDRKRFVQHLQKPDHHFTDYFYSTPGIIALELQTSSADLTSTPPLVIAQCVVVNDKDNPQRIFFGFHENDKINLDSLPFKGAGADKSPANMNEFKQWLKQAEDSNHSFFMTEKQDEWKRLLDSRKVEHELLAKQIDFCRAEGGISEFASFKDEKKFLEQFFRLTLEESTAKHAHQTLTKAKDDFKEIPVLENKQRLLSKLVGYFQKIHPLSQDYQRFNTEIQEHHQHLCSLTKKLQLRQLWLKNEIDLSQQRIESKQNLLNEKKKTLEDEKNAIKQTELTIKSQEYMYAIQELKETQSNADKANLNFTLSKAVVALDELDAVEAKHKSLSKQLNSANHEIEPLEKSLKNSGSQLIAAYDAEAALFNNNLTKVIEKIKGIEQQIDKGDKQQKSISKQLEKNTATLNQLIEWLRIYDSQLNTLSNKGHLLTLDQQILDVNDASLYWKNTTDQATENLSSITTTHQQNQEELESKGLLSIKLSNKVTSLEASIDTLQKEYNTAITSRQLLESAPILCKLIKVQTVNPDDDILLKTLDQAIDSRRKETQELTQNIGLLSTQKESLENDKQAKPDNDIESALEKLANLGLEAKYYPHYLAKQGLNATDARALVESDPARFYGIQVNSLATIREKLGNIDREKWGVSRPIIISESCIENETIHNHLILPVRNDAAYNPEAAEVLLQQIMDELTSLENKVTHNDKILADYTEVHFQLKSYQEKYGSTWLENQSTAIKNVSNEKTEQEQLQKELLESIEILKSTQKELSDQLDIESQNQNTAQSHLTAINNFINDFQKDENDKSTRRKEAETLSTALTQEAKSLKSSLTGLAEQKKVREREQDTIHNQIKSNTQSANGVIYKNDTPFVHEGSYNLHTLEAEYSTCMETYGLIREKQGLKKLNWKLEQLIPQIQEKQNTYERVKKTLGTEQVRIKQSHFQQQGIDLQHEESILGRQIKELLEAIGRHKNTQEIAETNLSNYKRQYPDISVIEEPLSPVALNDLLAKHLKNKEHLDKNIVKEAYSITSDCEKQKQLEADRDVIDATIKQVPEELLNSLVDEIDLSPAENINHTEISNTLVKERNYQDELNHKKEDTKKRVVQLFEENITRSVQIPENAVLLGAMATDIKNLTPLQLLDKSTLNIDTLQESLNVVNNKIHINKEKLNVINSCFDRLLFDADRTLHQAFKVRIPADMQHYSKKPILKSRLENKHKLESSFSSKQRYDLYLSHIRKVVETDSVDENGYKLAANFLLRAYEIVLSQTTSTQKAGLSIKIIKPHDVEVDYIPVDKMIGSGGEGLTAGILLYLVIANIRNTAMGKGTYDNNSSFLVLDNPFSKANKVDLIRPQTSLAKKLGIQLIFATGIEDLNAIGEFEHVIRLRKDRIDRQTKRQHIEVEGQENKNDGTKHVDFDKYKIEPAHYTINKPTMAGDSV